MTHSSHNPDQPDTQALALGSYRQDVAYTAALKSVQVLALGNYRQDVAYTAALKSSQVHALGSYRQDLSYTAALKSAQGTKIHLKFTDVEQGLTSVIFFGAQTERGAA